MRLRFIVPADVATPTGGNVYDLAAAGELRRAGVEVELVPVERSQLAMAVKQPWLGATLVDGILASPQPEVVESSRVGVLVHMPAVWRPGLTADRADELARLERRVLRAARPVVVTSRWTAQFLEAAYGLRDVAVARPGVESASLVTGSDPPLLVQLATLAPHKDQLAVVKALAGLKELPWQARLAGSVDRDPEYAAVVRNEVAARGLAGRVQLTGEVARERAWAGADLALLPSRAEAYGMVVTEALARGIPAVVAAGGPAEALGFDSRGVRPGVVVTPGAEDELAGALRRWLEDEDHRASLRASARLRRTAMTGWEVTASCLHEALCATC